MNQSVSNRIAMFKTVAAYLEQHNSIWSGTARLATAVQEFEEAIRSLEAATFNQGIPSGAANEKAAARESLEDLLFLTCEALGVLAHENHDHEITAMTEVSASSLRRLHAEELANRAELVLAAADARKTDLAAMQVPQAHLDSLEQAVERYRSLIAKPRVRTVERSTHTASVSVGIIGVRDILRNRIDRMVNLFRPTRPDFVAGYRIARVIVDRPATQSPQPAVVTQPSGPPVEQ